MQDETAEKIAQLAKRHDRQCRRFHARQPQPIGKILAQVVINNRYATNQTNAALEETWSTIVGPIMAGRTKPTGVNRGMVEVTVAHSAIAQELSFDAGRITRELQQALKETKITGVRYRVGTIG